mgnify:CR=1 FL=1
MQNLVNYYYKQPFIESSTQDIWYLIDVREETSLLKKSAPQVNAHLFNPETKKMRKISLPGLDANFSVIESGLVDEVVTLNRIFLT